ncbi:MAG: hypothetical protein ACYTEG_12140 [Planctomycetota bacterium]|jgi:tetratricopeptide (TPR) repeat protein
MMLLRAFFLVGVFAVVAAAGATRTIEFKTGKKKTVVLEKFDEQGLTFSQAGTQSKVAWDKLTPMSAFGARKELTSYDDAAQRIGLAEFGLGLKLFPEAMEQYEIALALGGLDEAAFEAKAKEVEKAEIAYLTARIDELLKKKAEPAVCLQAIKRLKERYPDHPKNAAYQPRIQELVDILAKRKRKAATMQQESLEFIERRTISGLKKKLLEPRGAEREYKRARACLRGMVKIDPRFTIVKRKQVQDEYDAIAAQLIACYLPVARLYMRERNYKRAVETVQKILFYDPIHEEALEMARIIRKNRITFKASDRSGIKGPIVTGR